MESLNKIRVTVTTIDTYLDLTYFNINVRLWDDEVVEFKNVPSFWFYDSFVKVTQLIDSMNQQFEILVQIKGNPFVKDHMKNALEGDYLKVSRISSLKKLAETQKGQKSLAEFLKFHIVSIN